MRRMYVRFASCEFASIEPRILRGWIVVDVAVRNYTSLLDVLESQLVASFSRSWRTLVVLS